MDITFNLLQFVAAISALVTSIYVLAKIRMPGSTMGGLLLAYSSAWGIFYWLQLNAVGADKILFWFRLQTACSYIVPSLFILFIVRYFEIKGTTLNHGFLLGLIPFAFSCLALTNDRHSFMWGASTVLANNQVVVEPSFPSYLNMFYLCFQFILVIHFFMPMVTSSLKLYKVRAITFILAVMIYATAYIISTLGYVPNHRNITPFIFCAVCSLIAWINPEQLYKTDVLSIAYESVIDEMKDAAIITDQELRIIYMNDAAKKLSGFEEYPFLALKVLDVLPDAFYVKSRREVKERSKVEYDGRVYDLRITTLPDWRGDARSHIFTVRDITELVEYSKSLENIIKEKTRELSDAERLVAIGETTMMVGHDLRNPLQVLKGISYTLKKTHKDNPEALKVFDKIDKNVFYMDKIVSDLQAYGKNREPDARLYLLKDLVGNAMTQLEVPGDVDIVQEFTEDFMVAVDWYLIQRVFINLFLNAVQAMPDGGKLLIKAYREGETHIIKIADTGIGITDENLGNLFKPLYTTKAKGTGLGLAVCKKIVESHGGSISVKSIWGKGTIFTITLPAFDTAPAPDIPVYGLEARTQANV